MKFRRHKFHIPGADCAPQLFPPPGPYWCIGHGDGFSIVVAFLPAEIEVSKHWPDATRIHTGPALDQAPPDRYPNINFWPEGRLK